MAGRIFESGMEAQKKRLLIIVLFGVAAVGAVLLFTDPAMSPLATTQTLPAVPVAPVVPAAASVAAPATPPKAAINNKTPILPEGAQVAGQIVRDIFAPPVEYARLLPQEPKPGVNATNGARNLASGLTPVLTGIIVGDSTRVAILRQGTISRSHRVGESAGAYRVASISADSVTLSGSAGTIVLKMGQ